MMRGLMDEHVVRFDQVTHYYGTLCALNGVSFEVSRGSIFGLIGPNGSGKSTTLNLITTLLTPKSGSIRVVGLDVAENPSAAKARIGYAPEEVNIYQGLSPREFGVLSGALHGMAEEESSEAVDRLLETFKLADRRDDLIGGLSKGMKRKSLLISALVHGPELLILDEPLDGLDVIAQQILKEVIVDHAAQGGTVIYSTHILEIVDGLCTHVLLLKKGKVITFGTLEDVRANLGFDDLARAFHDDR
jgi:ABC-2 type transport system ATP-binding protein